jgi:dihydroorotase-like cyclic amidohydrolase
VAALLQGDPRKYQTFLAMRPKRFEAAAIAMLIRRLHAAALADPELRHRQGFGVHIAHLANAEALPAVAAAKAAGELPHSRFIWAQAPVLADVIMQRRGRARLRCYTLSY